MSSPGAPFTVRPATPADIPALTGQRAALYHPGSEAEQARELPAWLADDGTCSFVAEADGVVIGFVEGRLRGYADGCSTSPVGYFEGWYVVPDWRRRGVGGALFRAFEAWARYRGCRELASDTVPENRISRLAHARLGFAEHEQVVQFRKALDPAQELGPEPGAGGGA